MVERNKGRIKVETPWAGPDSRTEGIVNTRIGETMIKEKHVRFLINFCIN